MSEEQKGIQAVDIDRPNVYDRYIRLHQRRYQHSVKEAKELISLINPRWIVEEVKHPTYVRDRKQALDLLANYVIPTLPIALTGKAIYEYSKAAVEMVKIKRVEKRYRRELQKAERVQGR